MVLIGQSARIAVLLDGAVHIVIATAIVPVILLRVACAAGTRIIIRTVPVVVSCVLSPAIMAGVCRIPRLYVLKRTAASPNVLVCATLLGIICIELLHIHGHS